MLVLGSSTKESEPGHILEFRQADCLITRNNAGKKNMSN